MIVKLKYIYLLHILKQYIFIYTYIILNLYQIKTTLFIFIIFKFNHITLNLGLILTVTL